eukprot:gene3841-biopygen9131
MEPRDPGRAPRWEFTRRHTVIICQQGTRLTDARGTAHELPREGEEGGLLPLRRVREEGDEARHLALLEDTLAVVAAHGRAVRTQTRRVQRAAVVGRDRLAPLGQDELELVGGRERVAIARAEGRQQLAQQLQCRLVVLLVGGGSVGGRALLAALDGADGVIGREMPDVTLMEALWAGNAEVLDERLKEGEEVDWGA